MTDAPKTPTPLDIVQAYNQNLENKALVDPVELENQAARDQARIITAAIRGDYAVLNDASPELLEAAADSIEIIGKAFDEDKWMRENLCCPDTLEPTEDCEQPHCPVCGNHYRIMIYKQPGKPCSELCVKADKGDHWPSRSSLVKE